MSSSVIQKRTWPNFCFQTKVTRTLMKAGTAGTVFSSRFVPSGPRGGLYTPGGFWSA